MDKDKKTVDSNKKTDEVKKQKCARDYVVQSLVDVKKRIKK